MTDLSTTGPINRCTAHRKNGERCKRAANNGMNVCNSHGGRAPQVRRKAQVRLAMSVDRLMALLLAIAEDESQPAPLRLAAIRDALDRAGLGSKQEIEIALSPVMSKYDHIVAGSVIPIDDLDDLSDPNVIDAEVVETEDEEYERRRDEADERRRDAEIERRDRERKRSPYGALRPTEQAAIDKEYQQASQSDIDRKHEAFLLKRMSDKPKRYRRRTQG